MKGITALYPPEESGVRAVLAGADVVLCVRNPGADTSCTPEMLEPLRDGLMRAVADGRIPIERIDASVRRILAVKARYRVGPAPGSDLRRIKGAAHLRTVAALLDAVAARQAESGRP